MNAINLLHTSEHDVERGPVRLHHIGRRAGGELVGATMFEAQPGTEGIYHFHHGNEEWLIVLDGRPTLRTPEGERELRTGDLIVFPRGPDGAHGISNHSDEPARWLVVSSMNEPDVIEYPDTGVVGAVAGDAPAAGRDAPFEAFFPRDAAIPYAEITQR
jgi:uncharacterized cupin superfamily protein